MNTRSKEIILYLVITLLTVSLVLLVIKWMAPGLLGVPEDRLLVRTAKSSPPFYEIIFNKQDLFSKKFLISDPIVKARARQLYPNLGWSGPHDVLGFRNLAVPNSTDLLVIGDSQTYGNNAVVWENWPHLLQQQSTGAVRVYSMATGGWGAIQYYYALIKGVVFAPQKIIIAFYSGNDAIESYVMAFASELGREFLPETNLAIDDLPAIPFPDGDSGLWPVRFNDRVETVFTPAYRHAGSMQHPAIDLGWDIIQTVIKRMHEICASENIQLYLTLIPTKEYVYRHKIKTSNISMPTEYKLLIESEGARIQQFVDAVQSIKGTHYIDVIAPLTRAAESAVQLYPEDKNGHPYFQGYKVIADTIAASVYSTDQSVPQGQYLMLMPDDTQKLIEIESDQFIIIENPRREDINANTPVIKEDQVKTLRFAGHVKNDEQR